MNMVIEFFDLLYHEPGLRLLFCFTVGVYSLCLALYLSERDTRRRENFKARCIIKKWIDEGLIKDRYKCYLTEELCFCETSIGCYWRR